MSCLNSFVGPKCRCAEEIHKGMVLAECWNGVIFFFFVGGGDVYA